MPPTSAAVPASAASARRSHALVASSGRTSISAPQRRLTSSCRRRSAAHLRCGRAPCACEPRRATHSANGDGGGGGSCPQCGALGCRTARRRSAAAARSAPEGGSWRGNLSSQETAATCAPHTSSPTRTGSARSAGCRPHRRARLASRGPSTVGSSHRAEAAAASLGAGRSTATWSGQPRGRAAARSGRRRARSSRRGTPSASQWWRCHARNPRVESARVEAPS
mmetsp:Transcript_27556/g.88589  ORF Transcript_27556/g.88589 Transcript_27556/m.88589 type:complete len:224 (-) Transcript_27556:797-1468(-)